MRWRRWMWLGALVAFSGCDTRGEETLKEHNPMEVIPGDYKKALDTRQEQVEGTLHGASSQGQTTPQAEGQWRGPKPWAGPKKWKGPK